MATKKERREAETKNRKFKRGRRIAILAGIGVTVFGFLVFFFVSIFNMVYPPVSGRDGAQAKKEKQSVLLYFSDKNELFLVAEERYIPKEKSQDALALGLVKALSAGSKAGHGRTVPENVTIKNVKIDKDGMAYANFSRDFIEKHPGGTTAEITTIYSLTNTLTRNIPSIKSVKILVESKPIVSIKGHVSTEGAFHQDKDLIVDGSRNI